MTSETRMETFEFNIASQKKLEKEEEKIWNEIDQEGKKKGHEKRMKKKGLRSMLNSEGRMFGLRKLFSGMRGNKGKEEKNDSEGI